MPKAQGTDWLTEFGIEGRTPPGLFTSKDQITPTTPQAHLLRRAFDALAIDGILCADHAPLLYFRVAKRMTDEAVLELHHRFWNHGGAALLVVITDDRISILSGMMRPTAGQPGADPAGLVTRLDHVAKGLQEFIVAVETGEFFRQHQRSFDPAQRVDRDLLDNLLDAREKLNAVTRRKHPSDALDALVCRLVFTCYLFDREIIGESYLRECGVDGANDLRELLQNPSREVAKDGLYKLFAKLGEDFNGDLFRYDLAKEQAAIQNEHIRILDEFFRGTVIRTGQRALFNRYDFRYIPIETISAIYERFLKDTEKKQGAFYTPRFLAEVVLDTALSETPSLIGKRFLDPACGSGIFLVGLFNRLAEEWKQANPTARNDRKATELMRLLQQSLFGVDVSLTACRVTAFSLYLAYLDQLAPRDIQALQKKGKALPRLVDDGEGGGGNILCADFFAGNASLPTDVSLVIGNPPWGSIAAEGTPAATWCAKNNRLLPDNQIAAAFIWKAAQQVADDGRVCLVLPHGVLFNHNDAAIEFQRSWVRSHAIERVLNLADYQRFLFETAKRPAIVCVYRKSPPAESTHRIEYWGPKADWTVTKAEVISVGPQDRSTLTVGELLRDLDGPDAPQIWKRLFWATSRDRRLLDRLTLYPRLRDVVRQPRDRASDKPWLIAEGFQPFGENDPESSRKQLALPSNLFVPATSPAIDLLLLESDCKTLPSETVVVRRLIQDTRIFQGPHVIVSKGFSSVAFANFDVSFQHALRGISAPVGDRSLLAFLAAYLRSPLARYFLFHTSRSWGISIQEAHVEEVLGIPFLLPDQHSDPKRSWEIVRAVADIVDDATRESAADFVDRAGVIRAASRRIEPLVNEYFNIIPYEKDLIDDTVRIVIDSTRPTRSRNSIPTLEPVKSTQMTACRDRVCEMLNLWAGDGPDVVRGEVVGSEMLGVGVALFEKLPRARVTAPTTPFGRDLLATLDVIRRLVPRTHATLDLVRGVMVFDGPRLYCVKPIGQRYWSLTAAMNDADEIAGTILMRSPKGGA